MQAMKRERGWNKGPRRARMKERFVRMPWIFIFPKTIFPTATCPDWICREGILPLARLRQVPPRQVGPPQGPLPQGRVRGGRPSERFPVLGIRRRYRPRAQVLHLQE